MSLTEEESNFLRFCFLNLQIATKAVRLYFDSVHPPGGLAGELTKSSVTLKGLRFMTKLQLNILYPSSGQSVTSADFDSTLIVCLLRNMTPRESAPVTGWDNLPPPGDTSTGADIARVKWYRNQLAHSKDGILYSTDFNKRWGYLEGAIGRLSAKGGLPMIKEARLAKHVVMDGSTTYMLLELRSCNKSVQKLTEMINNHQSALDILRTNKDEHEKKIHQVHISHQKGEAETQKLSTELSDYKNEYAEKLKACKNDIKKNEGIIKELQDQLYKEQNKIADLISRVCKLEIKYEQHDKLFKEHDEQIARNCEQITQHGELMAQQGEQMEILRKHIAQEVLRNQKTIEEDTRDLIESHLTEETFVSTKAVADGLLLLKQNKVLLLTGHAGTGKSRIGRHVLHMLCSENKTHKCMVLTLAEWNNMINRPYNVVLLFDDIFVKTNCNYNRKKDERILQEIVADACKGKVKVIITIRDTIKCQCKELFVSKPLFQYNLIDLSSDKFVLSLEEKHTILTKYMQKKYKSDYIENKGFVHLDGHIILKSDEVLDITGENPAKGFPLAVVLFVHNPKYFHLGSTFFDRPTEIMLEEINAIRRKGAKDDNFMIQYAVMVYTAINENCINPSNQSCATEVTRIIKAIYDKTIPMKKSHISDAVLKLKGSYLIDIPNKVYYRLHHPTLQESVILSFAQIDGEHINKIIPLISWSFFLKMVKPESYEEKDGEVVLIIPKDCYTILAERLADFYVAVKGNYGFYGFLHNLCNTEIFQQDYSLLLQCLIEALEKADDKDNHMENMISSSNINMFYSNLVHMKNKYSFLVELYITLAKIENQLDIFNFLLKIFKTIMQTSGCQFTMDYIKTTLIATLHLICSTKDVRNVKATLDILEENKIPVLLDQGIILTDIPEITSMFSFRKEYDNETCVFLTLCIWKAYAVYNLPVLEFLLSKYNQTPFDINLFFKMIYREEWLQHLFLSFKERDFEWPLSFKTLEWMIEKFPEQQLDNPRFILEIACKYQMFDTVEYVASVCKTFDGISCLQAFVDKSNTGLEKHIPFNQDLFCFLIKQIDITSSELIPVVKSVIRKDNVPDYMFDAFLPVCARNSNILALACEYGQFYLVRLIIAKSSHIEHLDIQSALMAVCKETKKNSNSADIEVGKLLVMKHIVEKFGFEKFDFKVVCQQACSSRQFKILEWLFYEIETTRLDVYTIIKSALINNKLDFIDRLKKNNGIESLDKKDVLESVTEYYTAECSTTMLELVRTVWDTTKNKEVLHIEEIVITAYERKCFELLMWIHENCHPYISIDSKKVLMLACGDYRVDVAEWVVQAFEQIPLDIDGGKIFTECIGTYHFKYGMIHKLIDTLNWILATFQIQCSDIISGVLKLISVDDSTKNDLLHLVISILEKYSSCIKTEDMRTMIDESLKQKYYGLVNWFLEKRSSCSLNKQTILDKACTDSAIETIKILRNFFYTLDMSKAMINTFNSSSSRSDQYRNAWRSSNYQQSVACLSLLWKEVNDIRHDSIDIRTIVSTVCKKKKVSNNVMAWILLNIPHEKIPINEILLACCQQCRVHHVKYIFQKVDNKQLSIQDAFVVACRAFPVQSISVGKVGSIESSMLVDFLFQNLHDKESKISLVLKESFEKKKFDLILFFLQAGYCRTMDMKNLLNEACRYGYVRLVQWILANVQLKELNIKSAFHEAFDRKIHDYHSIRQHNFVMCGALMWHCIQDVNMFDIDTVLKTFSESHSPTSEDDLKTWLLYIKKLNQIIYKSDMRC